MNNMSSNELKSAIAAVLRRYFEVDDSGNSNPEFDATFTAQDAIDEIHGIIGSIDKNEYIMFHVTGIEWGKKINLSASACPPANDDIKVLVLCNADDSVLGDSVLAALENKHGYAVECCAWDI